MDRNWESIRDEVFELDTATQAILVEELTEHLAKDAHTHLWLEEAKRRLGAYRRGEIKAVDPSETFAKTKQMIEEARKRQS
jgi:hypothetical protein